MTMRYAQLSPDVKREAVLVLDTPVPQRDQPAGTHQGHMNG